MYWLYCSVLQNNTKEAPQHVFLPKVGIYLRSFFRMVVQVRTAQQAFVVLLLM